MIAYSVNTLVEVPIFFILGVIGLSKGFSSLVYKLSSFRTSCAWIAFGFIMVVVVGIIAHI